MEDQKFQTRSEETGIKFFPTFKEALEETKKDSTIWKISFTLETGERIRLVYTQIGWVYEPLT